jgi:hypothetical protein
MSSGLNDPLEFLHEQLDGEQNWSDDAREVRGLELQGVGCESINGYLSHNSVSPLALPCIPLLYFWILLNITHLEWKMTTTQHHIGLDEIFQTEHTQKSA